MNVSVRYSLAPTVKGKSDGSFELSEGATLGDLKKLMIEQTPDLADTLPKKVCLINRVAGKDDTLLSDGDQLIIWQPGIHG